MRYFVRGFLLGLFLFALLLVTSARSGEIIDCATAFSSDKRLYRIVEGKECWFNVPGMKRGREKPLEELRWAPAEPPETVGNERPPWTLEERFGNGWDHKE